MSQLILNELSESMLDNISILTRENFYNESEWEKSIFISQLLLVIYKFSLISENNDIQIEPSNIEIC